MKTWHAGHLAMIGAAVLFYVVYDIISTIAAYRYLGSFEYEKSLLIRLAFDVAGLPGFLGVKIVMSGLAIAAASSLIYYYPRLQRFGLGILAGAAGAGLYVGTSNLYILVSNHSLWLFGLDSGNVAAIIIILCGAWGLISDVSHEGGFA